MVLGQFDACVAIARGGLVRLAIVARELNIRTVETVAVKSYDHQSKGQLHPCWKPITAEVLGMAKAGKRVLIVDDLVDTGATARVVRDMLLRLLRQFYEHAGSRAVTWSIPSSPK